MPRPLLALVCLVSAVAARADSPVVAVAADPPRLTLDGPNARFTLLVRGTTADGRTVDLTHAAAFAVDGPPVVAVAPGGAVVAVRDGTATVRVTAAGHSIGVPVTVAGSARPREFHFETDVAPLLGRFGCNMSGCHGKAEGQNGFKLSVFGFDPAADHAALVKEARGRRLFPASPEASLLLTKGAGQVPHGGGTKIPVGSEAYQTLRDWIAAGAPFGTADAPRLTGIRVEPAERVFGFADTQQLRVVATYSDGRRADVTRHARFQSNRDAVAGVTETGRVTAKDVPGEAAVMAGYMNEVAVFRVLLPRPGPAVAFSRPAANFIDPLVDAKLRKLNIAPSGPADDAEFLRRVSLDVAGTLPTAAEARAFLADPDPAKRAKLVDRLLDSPGYADLWALRWADLLHVNRTALGHKRAYAYYRWIRRSVADNKPFDRFAREVVTAEGPVDEVGPASYYVAVKKPGEQANALSQVFLGVRMACAECHHHPFDRWSQDDYAGLAAFFAPVGVRKVGVADAVAAAGPARVNHPRTGRPVSAAPLGGPPLPESAADAADPREHLATWLTAPDNPFFARNLANRVWAHLFGKGLVEPVDDVRATNPPTNPELLDALARHLVETGYDVKALVRVIAASRTYQTACRPNPSNEKDDRNYSRSLFRPVPAEVLCDMLSDVTGVPEKFDGVPAGSRAVQLWDSRVRHYLLKITGRPERSTACDCERVAEPTLTAVLHLLNSPELADKLRHDGGTVARWAAVADDAAVAEELTLTFFSRPPTARERAVMAAHLRKHAADRRKAVEDLAWALMNTREFVQNH